MSNKTVNFIEMVNQVSPEYSAYLTTPYKTYKFYAEMTEFGSKEIRIQVEDDDFTFGDFFGEEEYIEDWVNHWFTLKKNSQWIPCTFQQANRFYNSGCTVRTETSEGVIEEFCKTAHELKCLVDVVNFECLKNEWECRID